MATRQVAHRDAPGVVLVVTEVDDPTADLVIDELNRRRVGVARVDPGGFPHEVTLAASLDTVDTVHSIDGCGWRGLLATATREVDLAEVSAVYWRRPSPHAFPGLSSGDAEFARAQAYAGFGGVLSALPVRYVNHPHRNWAAEYKPAQLAAAVALGFRVPPTLVTSDPEAARAFAVKHAPVVFKPLRLVDLDTSDGASVALWTQRVDSADLDESIAGTAHLFQAEVVGKVADLRITVIGDRVFCVRIDYPGGVLDWRTAYESLTYTAVESPAGLAAKLGQYLARFGLTFGCFDFALDPDNVPWFLECNPNGQWAWLEPPTGLPMTAAFADAMEGAL